jgi:hypothetical protein
MATNQAEVITWKSQKSRKDLRVQDNLLKGLSDGSYDFVFGAMITGNF